MESSLILPALAALSVVLLIVQKVYIKLRSKFSIKLNCWFCCSDTHVPYNSSNSWYCPNCDQYNGFVTDGSYNRVLPEQFNEKLNCGSWCTRSIDKRNSPSNGLCRFCNINLELKIQQLAQFVPLNIENHDEEVQQYSEQLERVYRLCSRCQVVLKKTIEIQDVFLTNKSKGINSLPLEYSNSKIKEKRRHSVYLLLTSALSLCILLSVMPYDWVSHIVENYPLPEYILWMGIIIGEYVPSNLLPSMLLLFGAVVQLFDCFHMRDATSFTNLLLWIILFSLTQVPVKVDGLVNIVHVLTSAVFFITSLSEYETNKQKMSTAAVKPVQLQRLNKKVEATPESSCFAAENAPPKSHSPQSPVSDPSPTKPIPIPTRESTPEDFGFGSLNVNSRRLTRSQTKHFQPKEYKAQGQSDLFRPKPFNLTPPKLQVDKASEYQLPLTRSSSQSSGFVSLSHQRDFEDYRSPSPSLIAENIESVSQCGGGGVLAPYRSSFFSPTPFAQPFGMPFSNYHPYTIMHFTPPQFGKCYPYSNMLPYEPSLNLSNQSVQSKVDVKWYRYLKSALFSLTFMFLITSNIAILWKVFGEEYFKIKSQS